MYHEGWYRDVDARNGQPILLQNIEAFGTVQKDYYDIMMLTPVALGIATPDQIEGLKSKFDYFAENQLFWLEWPSFWQPFSEAAWNVGWRMPLGELLVGVGERVYRRIDSREPLPVRKFDTGLPERYNYRIPGVSMEFWPLREDNPGGCENYGWGATFPTLVIRNLTYRGVQLEVHYRVGDGDQLEVIVAGECARPRSVEIRDERDTVVAHTDAGANAFQVCFAAINEAIYTVTLGG